jgi:CheY-like chemotaxis protein
MNVSAHTVLYVEDMPVNVLVMEQVFALVPHLRLRVARSCAHACDVASTLEPSLMLLDIGLPDCRGEDLLRRLRALPGYHQVPAIAVTAEERFDARVNGFDECWPKPLDVPLVLKRLEELLPGEGPRG